MPQMSPLSWLLLYFMFMLFYMFIYICCYWMMNLGMLGFTGFLNLPRGVNTTKISVFKCKKRW